MSRIKDRGGKTKFVKGKSGNPNGRPVGFPKGLIEVRKLTAEAFIEIASTLLLTTDDEADAIIKDPNETLLNKAVCKALIKVRETGNVTMLDTLLNRVIGKVKEKIEHQGLRPTILRRRNGEEMVFTTRPENDDE